MSNAVRLGDPGTDGGFVSVVTQTKVLIQGLLAARSGDTYFKVVPPPTNFPIPPPARPVKTFIVGSPALRTGDATGSGGTLQGGATKVIIHG